MMSTSMQQDLVRLDGFGHAVGEVTVSNRDVARRLGRRATWYEERTGIVQRQVSGAGQNALTLAATAVTDALKEAGLSPADLGQDTVLLHIQNGFSHLTPPAGVVLAGHLGIHDARVAGLDGVCAEPVTALDHALLMLEAGRCRRAVLSASVDFLSYLRPDDQDTAGLFGSGAGAVVLSRADDRDDTTAADSVAVRVRALEWETHAAHWDMGDARVRDVHQSDDGLQLSTDFYTMRGQSLYRTFLQYVPPLVQRTLDQAGWRPEDVDLVVSHQPNPRLLELSLQRLGLRPEVVPMPGRTLGNMGPASLLVNLSMARRRGDLEPGSRVLLLAFGLGFSCGAVAVEVDR